jgi:uncharacterized protein (TIGR02449 family)
VGCFSFTPLLPVELRHVNHTASTNEGDFSADCFRKPYNEPAMPHTSQIDQIADRVDRLLVLFEELQRANVMLETQVQSLTQERDSLQSRLRAARSRVEALLDRLPVMPLPNSDTGAE